MKTSQAKKVSQTKPVITSNYWALKKYKRNSKRAVLLSQALKGTEFANKVRLDINGIHMSSEDFAQARKSLNPVQFKRLRQCLAYSI